SKGYITGKGKIKTRKLDFEDVFFVKELQHFNLFSVSQMCDKKNKVLFNDSEYLVLSPEFKLPDANQVLLRIPKQNNMYSFNLENLVLSGGKGSNWLFDLDYLTDLMNYQPVTVENKANKTAGPKEANHSASIQDNIDAGNSERSVLTLKPLLNIDPKDKGKGVLEEEPKPAKKLKKSDLDAAQLAMDKEYAKQVNVELQAELEREKVAAEEATQAVLASKFDEIQARMNADTLLAERLQEAEREQFSVE
ncbi:hypothetical protein Tco_1528290, partial [Tanacetum coccineum]